MTTFLSTRWLTKYIPGIYFVLEVNRMPTAIRKWGNGNGVRLSKAILGFAGLSVDDEVEILAEKGKIIILPVRKHRTLEDRVAEYAESYAVEHVDWGPDVGKEE
jgi:antitoxin MazE